MLQSGSCRYVKQFIITNPTPGFPGNIFYLSHYPNGRGRQLKPASVRVRISGARPITEQIPCSVNNEASPRGKARDFDSRIRQFDPDRLSQNTKEREEFVMSEENAQNNKERFLSLCKSIERKGIDELMSWLEKSDLTSPSYANR